MTGHPHDQHHTQKLINLVIKKAELFSLVNDLAMQVSQAAGNRVNPLAIVGLINSLTGESEGRRQGCLPADSSPPNRRDAL